MNNLHSDALVFFGATGDLAYKKIFPALQAMVKRGNLNVPVIGVAKAGWNLDQLQARAHDSLEKHGGLDPAAFDKLSGLLRYVDGDYSDPATFQALREGTRRRAASGPLSGHSAGRCSDWWSSNSARPAAAKARASSSKSRSAATRLGRGAERDPAGRLSTRSPSFASTITWASSRCTTCCSSASPTRCSSRSGTATTSKSVQITMAEDFGVQGRGAFYEQAGTDPRRDPKPPVPGAGQSGDGAAGPHGQRIDPRREGQGAEGDPAARSGRRGARPVPRLPHEQGVAPDSQVGDLCRAQAGDRFLALAGRSVLHPRREMSAGHLHRGDGPAAAAARHLRRRRLHPNPIISASGSART